MNFNQGQVGIMSDDKPALTLRGTTYALSPSPASLTASQPSALQLIAREFLGSYNRSQSFLR